MQAGAEQIDSLTRTLACPQCEYDLRGLPGNRFNCPECGLAIDVAELAMRQWIGPWWHAPGFQTILGPVAWAVGVAGLVGIIIIVEGQGSDTSAAFLVALAALAAIWVSRIIALRKVLPAGEGIVLSLLAHGLFGGYVLSVWGGLGAVAAAFANVHSVRVFFWVIVVLSMVALFWLCRRGERFIAERCIRHYLTTDAARG